MQWFNIAEYASDFVTFIERLNNSSTDILILLLVVGTILLGLVIMTWTALDYMGIRVIQCIFGALAVAILSPVVSILGIRAAKNVFKKIIKSLWPQCKPRRAKIRKEPTFE